MGRTTDNRQRQINIVDVLTWSRGAQLLKFGFDFRSLAPVTGYRTWGSLVRWPSVSDALRGTVPLAVVWSAETAALRMRYTNVSLFGQDTWRVNPRMTVTHGVRWEHNPPPKERGGRNPFTIRNLDRPEEMKLGSAGARLYAPTYLNIAPRIGVGYVLDDTPRREVVIRGAFGVFYDLGNSHVANGVVGFPYERARILRGVRYPLAPEIVVYQPFTLEPPYSLMYVTVPDLQLPFTYQWNASAERSIGSSQTVALSYVGALGRRLLLFDNMPPTGPFVEGVSVAGNGGASDYHALQVQFRRRVSDGLQTLVSYSLARARDITSSDAFVGAPFGVPLSTSYGPSDFDVRHTVSAAASYDLGTLTPWRSVLDGWGVDAVFRARSAPPVDVTFQGTGIQQNVRVRPDRVLGEPLYVEDPTEPGGRRFNQDAFAAHDGDRQGTLARNALRGFAAWQVDLALRRTVPLSGYCRLQLRGEVFNLLNHPNFGSPAGQMESAFFGRSMTMLGRQLGSGGADGGFSPLYQIGGPRSVQLSLRLLF